MTSLSQSQSVTSEGDRRLGFWLSFLILLAGVGFLFSHFLARQLQWAIDEPSDWGHTLLIPFIALYFLYLKRDQILATPIQTNWLGLIPLLFGAAWYMLCSAGPRAIVHHNLQAVGLGISLFGLVLLFFGWRQMRFFWFPLLYLTVFGVTISQRLMQVVTFQLQDIAARGSYIALTLLGVDTQISGNTLTLYNDGVEHALNIAEACSGMRMVVAFLALGVFFAYTRLPFMWQKILLVALAIPTALFVNILRVVTLGLLTLIDPDLAGGDFHEVVGLIWLFPAILLYLGEIWVINRLVIVEGGIKTRFTNKTSLGEAFRQLRFDRFAKPAVIVACCAIAFSAVGFRTGASMLNVHLQKKPVPIRKQLTKFPVTIGEWQAVGDDKLLSPAIVKELGTQHYLVREYARNGDPRQGRLHLHITYYTGLIDAVPHVPDRCWTAGGLDFAGPAEYVPLDLEFDVRAGPGRVHASGEPYRLTDIRNRITGRLEAVRLPIDDIELRVREFQHRQRPQFTQIAAYFFLANGRATAHSDAVRANAFDLKSEYAYYAKVEFAQAGDEFDRDQFVANVADFLHEGLPEIMRCLPDWSEVEAGAYPETDSLSASSDSS